MGKIRVTTIGDEEAELKEKQEKDRKRAEKKAREASEENNNTNLTSQGLALETDADTQISSNLTTQIPNNPKTKSPKKKFAKKKNRSAAYSAKVIQIDKNKTYSLSEGIELLRKVKIAKFDETVELHINTIETGLNGTMKLPHGNGKEVKVAIADDAVLEEVEKGKINFDILIATPTQMPKLAKVARVLGPRGLMPNPKNGTISENPEEAMKKFQGGQMSFKTESKMPLIHLAIGKTSFDDAKLTDNIKTVFQTIKKDKIRKVTLKSTMSPGIRIQV